MSSWTEPAKGVVYQPSTPADGNAASGPVRRPWHAPRFMLTDIALTDVQNGLTTDGNAAQSGS